MAGGDGEVTPHPPSGSEVPWRLCPGRGGPHGEVAMHETHPFAETHQGPAGVRPVLYAHPLHARSKRYPLRRVYKREKKKKYFSPNGLKQLISFG